MKTPVSANATPMWQLLLLADGMPQFLLRGPAIDVKPGKGGKR